MPGLTGHLMVHFYRSHPGYNLPIFRGRHHLRLLAATDIDMQSSSCNERN
jgi:hypothetical protein